MPNNIYGDIDRDPYLTSNQPDIETEIDEYLIDVDPEDIESSGQYESVSRLTSRQRDKDYYFTPETRYFNVFTRDLVLSDDAQAIKDSFMAQLTPYRDSLYQMKEDTSYTVAKNDLEQALLKLEETKMDAWAAKKQAEQSLGRGIASSAGEDVVMDVDRQVNLSANNIASNIAKLKSGLDYDVSEFRASYNEDLWDAYSDFIKAKPTQGGKYEYTLLSSEERELLGDGYTDMREAWTEWRRRKNRDGGDRPNQDRGDTGQRDRDYGPSSGASSGPAASIGVTEDWANENITAPIQNMFNSIISDLEQEI